MFKFLIYRKHEDQDFAENGECFGIPRQREPWSKFHFILDTDEVVIQYMEAYVLFDEENNPEQCTKVYLSDGAILFAAYKIDTFADNYKDFKAKKTEEILEEQAKVLVIEFNKTKGVTPDVSSGIQEEPGETT